MKKIKSFYGILLLSLVFIASCKKDDDPDAPTAGFTVSNSTVLLNEIVQFTNTSQNATAYAWSFGDGTTSTDVSPQKSYLSTGVFTVTLVATGEGGSATFSMQMTVQQGDAIYFIEYGNNLIKKLPLDGLGVHTTVLDITGKAGVGLAYDNANDKIYFSDFEVTGSGNIWRVNGDGTGLQSIASGLTDPYGIALDLTNGKIYWADDLGNISRSNLDGTNLQTGIVNIASGQMRAVALDVPNNKMYFYEVNGENLYVANLDGSNPVVLISGSYGYSIAVDGVNGKIYYDERNSGTIKRADLTGSGAITIVTTTSRVYGLAIDADAGKLYWADRDAGELRKANLDGSVPETVQSGLLSPRGIFLK
ncbi:MAG: PKD domain-containing protein [Bacteroidota bacterium]